MILPQSISSIEQLLGKYSHFIIDLWGVIHDGTLMYPGAKDALETLRSHNKTVLFLSNAPRKAEKAVEGLNRLGVNPACYQHVLTSGQTAYEWLQTSCEFGDHYYYLGPGKDEDVLDGLNFTQVSTPNDAHFVLNAGFETDFQPENDIIPTLERILAAKLPLICINPDLEVVKQDGTRMLCAGWVANQYEKMGGAVTRIGKPHSNVYEKAFEMLGKPKHRDVLAIGDNLHTDILGANGQNIDSLLITGGILKSDHGDIPTQAQLHSLFTDNSIRPTYVAEGFQA